MTIGVEQEDRLAELADEVHRARTAEARRRVERRRILVALAVVGVCAVVVLLFAIVTDGDGSGASVQPSTPATTTVASGASNTKNARAPTTVVATDPRPSVAPPVGTTPDPSDLLVLVDRERNLPDGWAPTGMVAPAAMTPTDSVERRLLRPEAARALGLLAAAAARDGVPIIGISAFRSQGSQQQVFDRYVRTDGEAAAQTFSARPGHSEHQTGLAVDVTSVDGSCPTEPCFGATPQAAWLVQHAPEFGFIVRYPAGKELVTTYTAEPWHLRYVGVQAAQAMQRSGLTLDEYLHAA